MFWLIFICSLVIISIGVWYYFQLELVQVEGESMYPTLKHGRIVLIMKRPISPFKLVIGKIYIYKSPDGYPVIKRLLSVEFIKGEAYLWFEGDNIGNSRDSRFYGYVKMEELEGILVFNRKAVKTK